MKDVILTVDLGGTLIRAAQMDLEGHIFARVQELVHAEQGREATLPRVLAAIRRVAPQDSSRLLAIGVGAPGSIDPGAGLIINLTNLPGWTNLPFRDILSQEFGCPVWLGNDANLAALAEQRFGAGRGVANFIYMTISTGIGGGIIVDHRLLLGTRGLAAEVGHMTIEAHGPRCKCGNIGCLEALANGAAIAQRARELIAGGAQTLITDLAQGDLSRVTAKLVSEAAQQNDPVALDVFRQAGFYIGIGLVNLMHLFNPALFILGGGVAKAGEALFEPIRATVRERAMPGHQQDVSIVPASLGDDVGLLGALALVLAYMSRPGPE